MCKFCECIAKNDEEIGKILMQRQKEDFIFVDDNKFNIYTDTGDSFCPGVVQDIHFCPMCGRELGKEKELPWVTVGMEDDCK